MVSERCRQRQSFLCKFSGRRRRGEQGDRQPGPAARRNPTAASSRGQRVGREVVRITGGKWAGRRLRVPAGGLRPTSDRVREALFAITGDLAGARVLDLCAGSGALGLEALSRGALRVVFVEQHARVLAGLRHNLVTTGARASCRVVGAELFVALRRLQSEAPFDLVLLDPPYESGLARRALGVLARGRLLAPAAAVVVESSRHSPPGPAPGLLLADERSYGGTLLSFYRRDSADGQPVRYSGG